MRLVKRAARELRQSGGRTDGASGPTAGLAGQQRGAGGWQQASGGPAAGHEADGASERPR